MPAVSKSLDTVAGLMAKFRKGDSAAAGELVNLFYPELRRIAAARMKVERPDHTLQPTALVNELYLELIKIKALRDSDSDGEAERTAFLRIAAHVMRRLLIHHARPLAKKAVKEELGETPAPQGSAADALVELDQTLARLEAINPNLRRVVELRVFEGLTGEEIAARMGCGTATVTRHWNFAREWLADAFGGDRHP